MILMILMSILVINIDPDFNLDTLVINLITIGGEFNIDGYS